MGSAGISDDTTTTGGAGDVFSAKFWPPLLSEVFVDPAPAAPPAPPCVLDGPDPDGPADDDAEPGPPRDAFDEAAEVPEPEEAPLREPDQAELAGTDPPPPAAPALVAFPCGFDPVLPVLPLASPDLDLERFCEGSKRRRRRHRSEWCE